MMRRGEVINAQPSGDFKEILRVGEDPAEHRPLGLVVTWELHRHEICSRSRSRAAIAGVGSVRTTSCCRGACSPFTRSSYWPSRILTACSGFVAQSKPARQSRLFSPRQKRER